MSETASGRDWLSIFILGLVWGASFVLMAIGLEGYGPVTVATARTVFAAIVLLAAMRVTRCAMPKPVPGLWPLLILIGLLSTAVPFLLLSWGMQHVPSVFGGLSMATIPLMVLVLAHFASDEKMIARRAAGVVLGFGGALVLIGPDLASLGKSNAPLGQLACIGAAFCYAISTILVRRCPPIDALSMAALTLAVGAIALVPVMLWLEGVPTWAGMRPGMAVLTLGLMQTAAMTLLRIRVIQSAGPVFMTLVNYQVPIWAMIYGAWMLNEDLPWQFFVALVMILCGLAMGQWRSLMAVLRR